MISGKYQGPICNCHSHIFGNKLTEATSIKIENKSPQTILTFCRPSWPPMILKAGLPNTHPRGNTQGKAERARLAANLAYLSGRIRTRQLVSLWKQQQRLLGGGVPLEADGLPQVQAALLSLDNHSACRLGGLLGRSQQHLVILHFCPSSEAICKR